jgi:heparan-alpha-glucosaminide N-acetyltransferase
MITTARLEFPKVWQRRLRPDLRLPERVRVLDQIGSRKTQPPRLVSLDAFRGFVIVTMIFVYFLSGVDGIPYWAKHMPGDVDGYTFVDLVLPGFLFIVGVAIPLAIHDRLLRGESPALLLWHVTTRAAGLLFLGVLLVNVPVLSVEATGLSREAWFLLALGSVAILLCPPPGGPLATTPRWWFGLRLLALVALGYALLTFRGNADGGHVVWFRHSWWGVLGLIGWAYLNCSLIYLAVRGSSMALMGALGFMLALYLGGRYGRLDWLGPINDFVNVGEVLGSTSANVMAGVLVGNLFVEESPKRSEAYRIGFLFLFGAGLYASGMLLRPLHGIVKDEATAAYTLVAAGICCLLFLVFYWTIDVRNHRAWARFLLPAGQNALLVYLLPDLVTSVAEIVGIQSYVWPFHSGWPGVFNTVALTTGILLLNWRLTRAGVRLRL